MNSVQKTKMLSGCYSPTFFHQLCQLYPIPEVDLFATQINAQMLTFHVSLLYKLMPSHLNLSNKKLYTFPPFIIISRVQQKIQEDKATRQL